MKHLALIFAALCFAAPATASEDEAVRDFVISNLLSTFYHELGHALVDVMELPVLGQEEDAADVLSAVMINELWQEDAAVQMASDTAFAFVAAAEEAEAEGEEIAWWDVHGPDLQRFYTLVCLAYGANPEEREDFVKAIDLPEDRAEGCPDEYDLAQASWGGVLEQLEEAGPGESLVYTSGDEDPYAKALAEEVADLNSRLSLPVPITVEISECGEENAFYDPAERLITVCREYLDYMAGLYDK